jgi:hypothetical protein
MARFLVLWHVNPLAPFPTDPAKNLELNEKLWAIMDGLMKKGEVKDYGMFPDGTSGYCIVEGETTDVLRGAFSFSPYIVPEVHDIISYEKQKETLRALCKAQIAATKK